MTAAQAGDGPVVYPVVVEEVAERKCLALLDSGAGSTYASAALIEQIGAQSHHSGMRKIEMMLGTVNQTMDIDRIKLRSLEGDLKMEADMTKVETPQLTMLKNPHYKNLLAKYPHLKGMTMDDADDTARLPVHLILGNSECRRISTSEPQVASYTKFGWTITLPGQGLDTTNSVTVPTPKAKDTKRGILAKVASIHDPLGTASPLILSGKLLYHNACNLRVGWDEQLPPDLAKQWTHWESSLPERIQFVRSLAVVMQPSGVTQGIDAAKARLATQGLKTLRLELVAGHMAPNLATNVKVAPHRFTSHTCRGRKL